MSTPNLEAFLARLYTDEAFLQSFLANPAAVALSAALTKEETAEVLRINTADLQVAARSFARKRHSNPRPIPTLLARFLHRLRATNRH